MDERKKVPKVDDLTWDESADFNASYDFLTLLTTPKAATTLVNRLRQAKLDKRMAKDILRASNLPAVDKDNPHVQKHFAEIKDGKPMHPVLCVVSVPELYTALTIADGYYATSTAYLIDNTAIVPVKIVTFDSSKDV